MAQDYNVDDILEEIRRKKKRETSSPTQAPHTYTTPNSRPNAFKEERSSAQRPARRERQSFDFGAPFEQVERPARQDRQSFDFDAPQEPSERPARRERQRFDFEAPQEPSERPARRERQRFDFDAPQEPSERPARRERQRFDFDAPQEPPERPVRRERQRFDFDAPQEPSERPVRRERQRFDFDAPQEPLERPARRERKSFDFDVPQEQPERPARRERQSFDFGAQPDSVERHAPSEQPNFDFGVPGLDADSAEQGPSILDFDADLAVDALPVADAAQAFAPADIDSDSAEEFFLPDWDDEPAAPLPSERLMDTLEIGKAPRRDAKRTEEGGEELARSRWQHSYAQQELYEEQGAQDDAFASPEDAAFVEKDIRSITMGLKIKLALTGILFVISAYLALSLRALPFAELVGLKEGYLLPLPPVLFPEEHMRMFLGANLLVAILAAIVCSNIVAGGLSAMFRLRADSDSPAALAVLGVLLQGAVLLFFPKAVEESVHISLYFPVAVAALFFNLIGRMMLIRRVWRNFECISAEGAKSAFVPIRSRELAREFARGLGPDADNVSYTVRTAFVSGFLERSYAPDYSAWFHRLMVPITLLGALLVGGVTFALAKDVAVAASAFAAVVCICTPLSATIMPNQMLARMSKKLTRQGAALLGCEAADTCCDTGAVILTDRQLFDQDSVMLHGMKVFAEKRIDEAILDAASVILSCNGIVSDVFLNMIGGNRRLLRRVDSLVYEDGLGISAWVDGKRVLIGNRELMRHHGVDSPSGDFESRYTRDGRRVLYLANSGELSAMFVLSYNPHPDIAHALGALVKSGVRAVVHTTDPNITAEMLAASFDVRRGTIKVMPAQIHGEYAYLTKPRERLSAPAVHDGSLLSMLTLLRAARAVRNSITRGTVMQLIGTIVGYGLVALMAFTGSLSHASFGTLLLFGLAWMAAVTGISASAK